MKLKQEYYDMIKTDTGLQDRLLKFMQSQDLDSLISMAHIKHDIFVQLNVATIITLHLNDNSTDGKLLRPIDLIADPSPECGCCKQKISEP